MRIATPLLVAMTIVVAWWLAPAPPPRPATAPAARVLAAVLGPLRPAVVSALRLRASFAKSAGNATESIRLQELALELDPADPDAAVRLAYEIAIEVPEARSGRAGAVEGARAGLAVLRRARDLGNGNPRIGESEVFLLLHRLAPPGASSNEERTAAVDTALAIAEDLAASWPPAHALASVCLDERGLRRFELRSEREAARDFERAAQHERLLARAGDPVAARRAEGLELRAAVCHAAYLANGDSADLRSAIEALERFAPDDPVAAIARSR